MKSITTRIRVYFLSVVISMGAIMAVGIGIILPEYYVTYQLHTIEDRTGGLEAMRDAGLEDEVLTALVELQAQMGGELYTLDEDGELKGFGRGKMSSNAQSSASTLHNNSSFVATGDVTAYQYTNKLGIEIYAYGIQLSDEYLVYEVDIQSLDDATTLMVQVAMVVIVVGLMMALLISLALTKQITDPIQALNELAHQMKAKEVQAGYVVKNRDELYELNGAMNSLYDELKSNIYQLESELKKERNTEMLKKRFLAQATHELKTPIAVIGGYAELLSDAMYENQEEHDHYIESIYNETIVMNHIIMDILDYSKMETGNFKMNARNQDVTQWFEGLLPRLKSLAQQRDKQLIIQGPTEGLMKEFDGLRMEQVINNLVSNGLEHAVSRVVINMIYHEQKVVVSVYNDGQKIDEEDLPYLFDSFYKAKGKKSGTGLGLAIVKSILQMHQGEYRAENNEDGVTFTVGF